MVKLECIYKSVKSDYAYIKKNLIVTAFLLVVLCLGYFNFGAIISELRNLFTAVTCFFTAVNCFIALEIVIMAIIFALILDSSTTQIKRLDETPEDMVITAGSMFGGYLTYWFISLLVSTSTVFSLPPFPDVFPQFIGITVVATFIITPLVVGYGRCRYE